MTDFGVHPDIGCASFFLLNCENNEKRSIPDMSDLKICTKYRKNIGELFYIMATITKVFSLFMVKIVHFDKIV